MKKRIYRSETERVIGGVCGGLGDYLGIDPTWIRILFVLSIFASGVGVIAYVIGWIVIPSQRQVLLSTQISEADGENAAAADDTNTTAGDNQHSPHKQGAGFLPGIILVIIGMLFMFDRVFYWFDFDYIWPMVLIGIGVVLIYRSSAPKAKGAPSTAVTSSAPTMEANGESQ